MNRFELYQALQAAAVRRGDYRLPDTPADITGGGVTLVLDQDGDRWVTYFVERGERYGTESFHDEDSACRHVYDVLTRPRRPPRSEPLSRQEAETAKQLEEQDRQEYEQWLISQGRDPATGQPFP